jgi:hypothetical protein
VRCIAAAFEREEGGKVSGVDHACDVDSPQASALESRLQAVLSSDVETA